MVSAQDLHEHNAVMDPAIEITNPEVRFPARGQPVEALKGINLHVDSGTVYGFLGPNGAGKTTTMHVLLGFLEPAGGGACIFDLARMSATRWPDSASGTLRNIHRPIPS